MSEDDPDLWKVSHPANPTPREPVGHLPREPGYWRWVIVLGCAVLAVASWLIGGEDAFGIMVLLVLLPAALLRSGGIR